MRPLHLELENFLSHRHTVVDLDGAAAIAIVGENGAGKTSLIEAISWCVFGKGRGRGPDDFVSAGGTECRVTFDFELDDHRYRVERQRQLTGAGKSSLSLQSLVGPWTRSNADPVWSPIGGDHISETQAVIEQLLGLDYDTWEATAYIGQGRADRFTQLKPAARKELLADVLGLSLYDALHEKAKARARELGHDAEVLRRQIADLEEQTAAGEELAESARTAGTLLKHAAYTVSLLETEVAQARSNLEEARAAAAGADEALRIREDYSRLEAVCEELERNASTEPDRLIRITELEEAIAAAKQEAAEARENEGHARTRLGAANRWEQLDRSANEIYDRRHALEMAEGPECFACRQPLDPATRDRMVAELTAENDRLVAEQEELAKEIHAAQNDAAAYRIQAEQAEDRMARIQRGLGDSRSLLATTRTDAHRLEDERRRLEQLGERVSSIHDTDVDALQRRVQLSSEALAGYERRLANGRQEHVQAERAHASAEERLRQVEAARARLESLREQSTDVDHELRIFERLAQAFGRDGIPALIIETAIPELEAQANHLLQRLTAGRFTVRIDSLKATKTAGVKDTLDITVGDDVSERPLEALSGGERQCVDLALRIALSRLLAHRAGRRIQTLAIDEGFTALDVAHRQRTIQLLHDLLSEFDCILFVTHLRELADAFPARLQVTRDEAGSHVQVLEGAAA